MVETKKHELKFLELVREGRYAVRKNGGIYRTWCGVCHSKCYNELPVYLNERGYCKINFHHQGKKYQVFVHRVVYTFFQGEIPEGLYINHIDGNPGNNALSNLEAVTPRENHKHAIHVTKNNKCFGAGHPRAKLKPSEVIRIIYFDHSRKYTKAQLAEMYGVSKQTIFRICRRKSWRWILDQEYLRSGAGVWWKEEERHRGINAQRHKGEKEKTGAKAPLRLASTSRLSSVEPPLSTSRSGTGSEGSQEPGERIQAESGIQEK